MPIDLAIASLLHVVLSVVWVGGMFFAYMMLRPAAGALPPPQRLTLWDAVFGRFFPWVWAAVLLVPSSGYWLGMRMYGRPVDFPLHVHVMQGLGWIMVVVFLLVYFLPFRDLHTAVSREDWPAAGAALQRIRRLVGLNLLLGLLVVISASAGRFLPLAV